jgi:hypothetical protein
VAAALQRLHDPQLVRRVGAVVAAHGLGHLGQLAVAEAVDVGAAKDDLEPI